MSINFSDNINYNPSLTKFDSKIDKNQQLTNQELKELGKVLRPLVKEKTFIGSFLPDSDKTLFDRASAYIEYRKKNPILDDVIQRTKASAAPVVQPKLSISETKFEKYQKEYLNEQILSDLKAACQEYPLVERGYNIMLEAENVNIEQALMNLFQFINCLKTLEGSKYLKLEGEFKNQFPLLFTGQTEFHPKTVVQMHAKMFHVQISSQKPPFAINPKILQQEVDLREAVTISKEKLKGAMVPLGTSVNEVFRLDAAYFKKGRPQGIMEKFVWRIAEILGAEEHFTGTKTTSIQSMVGGIQKTIIGTLYVDWLETKTPRISDKELMKAMAVTLTFGFFDAHNGNMIVTPEGKVRFFDNTRSMPFSNGLLKRNEHYSPSFRSALFSEEIFLKPLSHEMRMLFQNEINRYRSQFNALEQWMGSRQATNMINQLPPGWVNKDLSLSAMRERFDRLDQALKDPAITTMDQLVFAVHPQMKFFAAVKLAAYSDQWFKSSTPLTFEQTSKIKNYIFENTGSQSIDSPGSQSIDFQGISIYMEKASQLGFDPAVIEGLAKKELTLDNMIVEMQKMYQDLVEYKKTLIPAQEKSLVADNKDKGRRLIEDSFRNYPIDLKDFDAGACQKIALSKFKENLEQNEFVNNRAVYIDMVPGYFKQIADPGDYLFIKKPNSLPTDPVVTFVKKLDSGEVQETAIDWKSYIGRVTLDNGEVLTVEEFKKRMV